MRLVPVLTSILLCGSNALIHKLTIKNDDRALFKIETFGFVARGMMNFTVEDFSLEMSSPNKDYRIGFLMRKASSESTAQEDLDTTIDRGECIFDKKSEQDYFLDLSDRSSWKKTVAGHVVSPEGAGLYSLIFARCLPAGANKVNFKLYATFQNPGPNYLSAGDAPLPALYMFFFVVFVGALVVWCYVLFGPQQSGVKPFRIHYMMGILLLLKCITLLFESIRYHYIAASGFSEAWSILYYFFTTLRGIMLFTVILLIGSGWSLMKPYINDREKKIIVAVLTLQVLDNVAMVVLEETAPGTQDWLTWRDLLHLIDIICCCAILFPIVWSIKHLRQAAETDGKMQMNIAKLQRFRQFYVLVVCYIYFTRIIVYLLAATIPFYLLWLSPLFTELATLVFFVITGYKFRPAADNPYLTVATDEDDDDDEDVRGRRRDTSPGGNGIEMGAI